MLDYLIRYSLKYNALPADEEKDLILKAQAGDIHSKQILFDHHLRNVFYVIMKYESYFKTGKYNYQDFEDLCSIMCERLYRYITKFDVSKKYKLDTYIVRMMHNEVARYLKATNRKTKDMPTIDRPVYFESRNNDEEYNWKDEQAKQLEYMFQIRKDNISWTHTTYVSSAVWKSRNRKDGDIWDEGLEVNFISPPEDTTDDEYLYDKRLTQQEEFILRRLVDGYTESELSHLLGLSKEEWIEEMNVIKEIYKARLEKRSLKNKKIIQ